MTDWDDGRKNLVLPKNEEKILYFLQMLGNTGELSLALGQLRITYVMLLTIGQTFGFLFAEQLYTQPSACV